MKAEKTNITKGNLVMPKEGTHAHWLWGRRAHDDDDCLMWPFYRTTNGYGTLGVDGKMWRAHRFMCSMIKGERSYPEYEVLHSCGRGQDGCVNPKHLSWGTKSDNMKDRRRHGTKAQGRVWKLTPAHVMHIRRLRGLELTRDVAQQFGVSEGTIRQIWSGQLWRTGKYAVANPNRVKSP